MNKVAIRSTWINAQPGLIGYLEEDLDEKQLLSLEGEENGKKPGAWYPRAIQKGKAAFVMVLTCTDNQIQEIDIIVNPEKLQHIPARNGDYPALEDCVDRGARHVQITSNNRYHHLNS